MGTEPPPDSPTDSRRPLPPVGANVRWYRQRRGLSVRLLADLSGVSKTMLSQIELGRSVPTVNLLWKVSRALDVSLACLLSAPISGAPVLLPARAGKLVCNDAQTFTSRNLFPFSGARRSEFYELKLLPAAEQAVAPLAAGASANVVVGTGHVEILVGKSIYGLRTGDALAFAADAPHCYRNSGPSPAVLYQVLTFAAEAARPQGETGVRRMHRRDMSDS